MRKFCKYLIAAAAVSVFAVLFCVSRAPTRAAAANSVADEYGNSWEDISSGFVIDDYDVAMDVSPNRVISVEETISVRFTVSGRSGIIRDLPLDRGVRYTGFSVRRDGAAIPYSFARDADDIVSVYLGQQGSYRTPNTRYTYAISYTMTVPKLEEDGYLPIDVLGSDWQAAVASFRATVNLPAGLQDYKVYSDADTPVEAVRTERGIELTRGRAKGRYGITLDLSFADGALLPPPADLTPLYAVIAVGGAFFVLLLIKLLFRNPVLVRPIDVSLPDTMDPLRMGKIIDGKVDSEDVTSLVYYLAAQGYLTLDFMQNDEDPTLAVTGKSLDPALPRYVKDFFEGLFDRRDRVKVSTLTGTFYPVVQNVTAQLEASEKNYFKKSGYVIFALLSVFIVGGLGLFPLIWGMATVSAEYHYFSGLFFVAAAYLISAAGGSVASMRAFKWRKGICIFLRVATLIGGCLVACLALLYPSPAFGKLFPVTLALGASLLGASANLVLRTRQAEYNKNLGKVLGFKDFIVLTEKEKIAFMLKRDPELYFRILPYAQVLGVTEEWTDKFYGLTLTPPSWAYFQANVMLGDLLWLHSFAALTAAMSHSFAPPRPTNSGGGFHGGGFGGGFSGGGFGGGGGRSF